MLELTAVGALGLAVITLWIVLRRRAGRPRPADGEQRLQALADGLLQLQRTLDARLDQVAHALNTALVGGLTQLTTQLVSQIEHSHQASQTAIEQRWQAMHRDLRQQFEAFRAHVQAELMAGRQELFGLVATLQQGVERRLDDNLTRHGALFRDMAEKLGELRVTNERIVAISQDINQLSRILESPKLRGNLGEFELERLLGNVLPRPLYRLQAPVGAAVADAVLCLDGGWLCIDSKFPLDHFRRMADGDAAERQHWRKLFLSDVRRHITDIAHKYIQPPTTLDFALMFIPAETVYYELLLSDAVLDFARARRVVPVSPNTLYAYLQAIAVGFRGLKIAQETRRIEQLLLGLRKNFEEFKEHFRLLGRHLDRARGQFIQAESDVSRFDHVIGGIQFGALNGQPPALGETRLRGDDAEAAS
jgi:DNA recombination protein RmuC